MSAASLWRKDFPLFKVHPDLHYLDAAATSQRPQAVLDSIRAFHTEKNANVHRGIYALAENATAAYEAARETVRQFLNAVSLQEIVFTSGATMGMNFLAETYGRQNLRAGDEIILSALEHHAVIVPWTELARSIGATVKVIPLTSDGQLDMAAYASMLSTKTKVVVVSGMSNVLGTAPDLAAIADAAHKAGAVVFVDAAQLAAHRNIDVQALPIDALVFSGHKTYGDFGSGVLWGRAELLSPLPPYLKGGSMIKNVTFDSVEYLDSPHRFEAGTVNIVSSIALAAGLDYMTQAWTDGGREYEDALGAELYTRLQAAPGVQVFGPEDPAVRGPIVSFAADGIHAHDLAQVLDQEHVAVRAGHHCTQPLHQLLGVPATARASIGLWNDESDIEALITGIAAAQKIFGKKA